MAVETAVEVAEAATEVEAGAPDMETVSNDGKQVVTAMNRWQQW
jgi:hypothetical protein